jgi:hypothetical protein
MVPRRAGVIDRSAIAAQVFWASLEFAVKEPLPNIAPPFWWMGGWIKPGLGVVAHGRLATLSAKRDVLAFIRVIKSL